MREQPWKALKYIKEIRMVPKEAGKASAVEFHVEDEYMESTFYASEMIGKTIRDHETTTVKFWDGWNFEVLYDYPEEFKKLAMTTGDLSKAYNLYLGLNDKSAKDWHKYIDKFQEGDI